MLPRRIPKPPKRASRWRSQAHCNFLRSHACCNCGSETAREVAHVRIGSGAGIGQKPDDFHAVVLCAECHRTGPQSQHTMGEPAFWEAYRKRTGHSVWDLIEAFIKASPKRHEIEQLRNERKAA